MFCTKFKENDHCGGGGGGGGAQWSFIKNFVQEFFFSKIVNKYIEMAKKAQKVAQ
jgi:hypothetical protein